MCVANFLSEESGIELAQDQCNVSVSHALVHRSNSQSSDATSFVCRTNSASKTKFMNNLDYVAGIVKQKFNSKIK